MKYEIRDKLGEIHWGELAELVRTKVKSRAQEKITKESLPVPGIRAQIRHHIVKARGRTTQRPAPNTGIASTEMALRIRSLPSTRRSEFRFQLQMDLRAWDLLFLGTPIC